MINEGGVSPLNGSLIQRGKKWGKSPHLPYMKR